VDHLAFYADQQVKGVVPRIMHWFDAVDWSNKNATRLLKSADNYERMLGGVIALTRAKKAKVWDASVYQVFILSGPKDDETQRLSTPISHSRRGRGSAFAQGHRYHAMSEILSAKDTADLALP
jgi:hypothetical protein